MISRGYAAKLEEAREIVRRYEESVAGRQRGHLSRNLIVSKPSSTREPREVSKSQSDRHRRAAALWPQQVCACDTRPDRRVHIITDAGKCVANDRVRAYALWDWLVRIRSPPNIWSFCATPSSRWLLGRTGKIVSGARKLSGIMEQDSTTVPILFHNRLDGMFRGKQMLTIIPDI